LVRPILGGTGDGFREVDHNRRASSAASPGES
jgi:hypothetical protein